MNNNLDSTPRAVEKKNNMRFLIIVLLSALLVLIGCSSSSIIEYINPDEVTYEIEVETDLIDFGAVQEAAEVIEKNSKYIEKGDLDGYFSTIVTTAHESTRSELEIFFEWYELEQTILSVTVLEQSEESILIEVVQQTIANGKAPVAEEYLSHRSTVHHNMVPEDGEWRISQSITLETIFIEE